MARRPDFLLAALVGILALATGYYWLLSRVSTLQRLVNDVTTEPVYLAALVPLLLATFALFGLNVGTLLVLQRARAGVRAQAGTLVGATAGAVATGCPLCGAYLLTLAGVTSGLGALPFGGLEVWLLAASLMALAFHRSLVALGRRCDPNDASGSCGAVPSTRANDVAGLLLVVVLLATVLVVLVLAHEPAMR